MIPSMIFDWGQALHSAVLGLTLVPLLVGLACALITVVLRALRRRQALTRTFHGRLTLVLGGARSAAQLDDRGNVHLVAPPGSP